jgi:hypothetical protein
VQLEGLSKLKKKMTSGLEPATFRLIGEISKGKGTMGRAVNN